jgi:hypothetical protein
LLLRRRLLGSKDLFIEEVVMRLAATIALAMVVASPGYAWSSYSPVLPRSFDFGYNDYGQSLGRISPYDSPSTDFRTTVSLHFMSQMQALHDEGVTLQARDGGTLTPEHRQTLQKKLDALQTHYRTIR